MSGRRRVDDPTRDRFVLSKGHAAPALYAVGAYYGFCDRKRVADAAQAEQPVPGPSACAGPALGGNQHRLAGPGHFGRHRHGDGPEAAEESGARLHHAGRRRIAGRRSVGGRDVGRASQARQSLRRHRLQQAAERQHATTPSCGWSRWPTNGAPSTGPWPEIDGHDIAAILDRFPPRRRHAWPPAVIIAHTVKGKGVPYMENIPAWHGSVKFTREQAEEALTALGADARQRSRSSSMSSSRLDRVQRRFPARSLRQGAVGAGR